MTWYSEKKNAYGCIRGFMPNLHKKVLNGIYCMCDNDTATTTTTSQVMKKKRRREAKAP